LNNRLAFIYKRLKKFYGPQHWWPADTPFEVVVGAILTQNTSWANVEKAIRNLRRAGGLSSPRKLYGMSVRKISHLIKPCGFYNLKTKRLRNFLNFLDAGYRSDLKKLGLLDNGKMRARLLAINGIGPETCDSIMLYAFNRPVFVVDAYTKRILSRHGLIPEKSSYEEVQDIFMKNLSRDSAMFNEYHALIVRLAKDFCRKKPLCGWCPLGRKYLACK
jgi:endonuclease III related protein